MSTVVEIEAAIEQLPSEEQQRLREWFLERSAPEDNDDMLAPAPYRQKILNALDQP